MVEDRYYAKNIAELNFSGYKFVLYYAEMMDNLIAEFPHRHNLYEIYYVIDGDLQINIEGKQAIIEKSQACFLEKNVSHHVLYEPYKSKSYFALIFDVYPYERDSFVGPDGVLEYGDIVKAMEPFVKVGSHISEAFDERKIVKDIETEIKQRKLGWNTMAVMLCYQFFIRSLRHISKKPPKDVDFSGRENLAMSVSKYIHKHYSEKISVESVAKDLNVSPRHINRAYKSMFSTTFMKNANLLRIAYAKDYLCSTDFVLEEISEKIGFTSPQIMNKLFQKYEGISPAQFRMIHRNSEERIE